MSVKINFKKYTLPTFSLLYLSLVLVVSLGTIKFLKNHLSIFLVAAPAGPAVAPSRPNLDGLKELQNKLNAGTPDIPAPDESAEVQKNEARPNGHDLSTLRLAVYNATSTPGLALKLKEVLEADGCCEVGEVGSQTEKSSNTMIKIKESKRNRLPDLEKLVQSKHAFIKILTLSEAEIYDAIIIIGAGTVSRN